MHKTAQNKNFNKPSILAAYYFTAIRVVQNLSSRQITSPSIELTIYYLDTQAFCAKIKSYFGFAKKKAIYTAKNGAANYSSRSNISILSQFLNLQRFFRRA